MPNTTRFPNFQIARFFIFGSLIFLGKNFAEAQVSVSLDRANQFYEAGETAKFRVVSQSGGAVSYKIGYDASTPVLQNGSVNTLPGVPAEVSFSLNQPGSVFFWAEQNGLKFSAQAVFSPQKIQPAETEPDDFDAFWASQKAIAKSFPLNPVLTFYSQTARSTTYLLQLDHLDGRKIYGYLSIPNGSGPFPGIVYFPPVGFNAGLVHPMDYMTDELGCISVALSIHNAPPDQTDPVAYTPNDATNRNTIYYRYAILEGLRVLDYLFSRSDFDGQNLATFGESQGGGLSMMVAGLDNRVDLVIGSIAALSEHGAWKYGRATGFPNYVFTANFSNGDDQAYVAATQEATKYYDAQFFARRFSGETFSAISYRDEVSPAATIFSMLNQTSGRQTILHALDLEHNNPNEYWLARNDAIRRVLVPTRTPQNNQFPPSGTGYFVNAGADFTATVGQSMNLNGSVQFNLADNFSFPVRWEMISGPAEPQFSNPNSRNPSVVFPAAGNYVVRFSANDESLLLSKNRYFSAFDVVKVVVENAPPPPCSISATATMPICFDNATPFVGSDDFWRTNLTVTAANGGTTGWRASYAGQNISGNYGTPTVISATNFAQNLSISISDVQTATCSKTISVVPPPTCVQVQPCLISATATTPVCFDNATPTDASDDFWRTNLTVTASNGGTGGWRASFAGQNITGIYGVAKTISVSNFSQNLSISISDAQTATCSKTISVAPPPTCVQVQPCLISAMAAAPVCFDNATPFIGSDDFWRTNLTVTAANGGTAGWRASFAGQNISGNYGSPTTISVSNFSQNLSISISDAQNATCSKTILVVPPPTCFQNPPPPNGTFCSSKGMEPWWQWIKKVEFAGISNVSDKEQYFDFSGKIGQIEKGKTYPIILTPEFSWLSYNEFWRVWIDWNHDSDFEDPGEMVFENHGTAAVSGQILVPTTATETKVRMRISMKNGSFPSPCEVFQMGEVEDYSLEIRPASAGCSISAFAGQKICADNGTPFLGSDDSWSTTFTVSASNGSATGWTGRFLNQNFSGNYNVPVVVSQIPFGSNVSFTFTDAADLNCLQTISVVPPAACVQNPPPPPSPIYCPIISTTPWFEWISKVTVNNILVKSSGKSAYSDFTATEIPMRAKKSQSLRLEGKFSFQTRPCVWQIWLDLNQNKVFDSPSEMMIYTSAPVPNPATNTTTTTFANFQVPATAKNGKTRMRIIFTTSGNARVCDSIPFGEVEDYTVVISDGVNGLQAGDDRKFEPEKTTAEKLSVFPVPASGKIFVEAGEFLGKSVAIKFYDLFGKPVLDKNFPKISSDLIEIDISDLHNGFYQMTFESPGRRILTRKLVVEQGQ